MSGKLNNLGFGLGLRTDHYQTVLDTRPDVDWFEVITENYLVDGGKPLHFLDLIRQDYPMVMHGVSMSIGGTDPLDFEYLEKVRNLSARIEANWISDHLCWTGISGMNSHDLLPLPYTEEALDHLVSRINAVQDFLGQQILLENVSSYVTYKESEMSEWDFLGELLKRADCLLLLDVNNIYVSAFNHDFSARSYINALPAERIQQIHLAGHTHCGTHIIDTHDEPVIDTVWGLYQYTCERIGSRSTMIERDDNIPPLDELLDELTIAKAISSRVEAEKNGLLSAEVQA